MTDEIGLTRTPEETGAEQGRKFALYGGLAAFIVFLDQLTKYIAQTSLIPYRPVPVIGDYFRFTFIYNPGAAFGLHVGELSRYIFLALTVACLVVLWVWFRSTPITERTRLLAIALVTAGALGNFIDRLRSARGVIDFLDVGVGNVRWPVFNIADIGVTVGALVLAVSLWREDQVAREDEDAGDG